MRHDQLKSASKVPIPPSFSLDGKTMAFYDGRTTVVLFDVEKRKVVELVHDSNFINLVSFVITPEGRGICIATVLRDEGTYACSDETNVLLLERIYRPSSQPEATYQISVDEIRLSKPQLSESLIILNPSLSYSTGADYVILVYKMGHKGTPIDFRDFQY